MKSQTLAERIQYLNVQDVARQVAKGKLTEVAAADVLYPNLCAIENYLRYGNIASEDRYLNFYG